MAKKLRYRMLIFALCSHLSRAKEEAAMRVLAVLSKHRRKVLLLKLLKSLRFIKTLQQTDVRLKELLDVSIPLLAKLSIGE